MAKYSKHENPASDQLVVGRNPVREALERGAPSLEKVMLQKGVSGRAIQEIRRLARAAEVPVQVVPVQRINNLVQGVNHQGVAALTASVPYLSVEEMLHAIAPDPDAVRAAQPIVLVLDRIQDPYNFGAILRSGVAAGVAGVIVPIKEMAPLNAAAMKTSAGTARRVPIARTANLVATIHQLKERGYWVAGAVGSGETSVWKMDWARPVALVIGNEERGLSKRVAEVCDYQVAIPIQGPVESLNASVAAGILLFAAARTRADGHTEA